MHPKTNIMEISAIEGYEGLYSIREDGKVIAERKIFNMPKGGVRITERRVLKDASNTKYQFVVLQKNAVKKHKQVHRLVAEAFIPNPENKPEVNHKDGDKTNNKKSNLEWATRSENQQHAVSTGLRTYEFNQGTKNFNSLFTEDEVRSIRKRWSEGTSSLKMAREFGTAKSTILRIAKKQTYKSVI